MALLPACIIFVNDDLTANVQARLVRQLHINEVVSGSVFDGRITANSDYPAVVKQLNQRLMVVRSFEELTNRTLADVVIFVSNGMASVLDNKFGPPGLTAEVCRITWGKLCHF